MTKLQGYFDYFEKYHKPKQSPWYLGIKRDIDTMKAIQEGLPEEGEFVSSKEKRELLEQSFKNSTHSIKSIEALLEKFVFRQKNGMADVQQGVVWDTKKNPHKRKILDNATPERVFKILSSKNKVDVANEVKELLSCERNLWAVRNRFMRTLFPDDFGSPDAPNKLDRLLNAIDKKLGIKIGGESVLDKHQNLCKSIDTEDPILRQIFTWKLFYMLENEVHLKKAICYYGAPGTGKTYRSSKDAKKWIDAYRILVGKEVGGNYAIKTVQFHPSYSYEDFMEGIRPDKEGKLKLFNGSFKQFCKDNGKGELKLYTKTNFLDNPEFEDLEYDFARIKVSQLKQDEKEALGLGQEEYAKDLTLQEVMEPAFFIIDEINRAELSKVFGELMYSLEYRGYRGKIKTQYSHLCESAEDQASFLWEDNENWFFIPQNIYIIATMNNIDRSVDAFDFALRRRFMWKEVKPNYDVVVQLLSKNGWGDDYAQKIAKSLKSLNTKIEEDSILDKNYCIGQSYVLELTKLKPDRFDGQNSAKQFIWNNFIGPLLEEYLKGLGSEDKVKEKLDGFKGAFI